MIPRPGSLEARAAGCTCPRQPATVSRFYTFNVDCPMHGGGDWQDLNQEDPDMHPCADCGKPTGGDPDDFPYCGMCLAGRFRAL